MEKSTDLEVIGVGLTNGLNKKFGHLLVREKFIKYDTSLITHFLAEGESFSSVPMVNYDKVTFIKIPPKLASEEGVEDEDMNQEFLKFLGERDLVFLLPDIIKLAQEHRAQLPHTFKQMLELKPINKAKHPKQYEFLRKSVMEPEFFPLPYAKHGFYQKPKEVYWKDGRRIYLLATPIPKLTEHDLFRIGYFELLGEFLSASIDPFILKLATYIHYAIHIIPEEWKAVVLLSYSPVR